MSQVARHPAYLQVEDLLDAIGQRYRVFVLARGCILLSALVVGATVVAALLAGVAGPGWLSRLVLWAYALVLLAGAAWWVVRPLVMKPRLLAMARMVEQRLDGIHNGLTNAVLLAQAEDLESNPWMGEVLTEIAQGLTRKIVESCLDHGDPIPPALSMLAPGPLEFTVPVDTRVKLSVYNSLGVEVATLVDESLKAGVYVAPFDASQLPSGTYNYRLVAVNANGVTYGSNLTFTTAIAGARSRVCCAWSTTAPPGTSISFVKTRYSGPRV